MTFSSLAEKYPMRLLSGDQNGVSASMPLSSWRAVIESSARTQSWVPIRAALPTRKATWRPSGEMTEPEPSA